MKLFILLICNCYAICSYAQIPPDSLSTILTGRQKKEWVVTAWKIVMGVNPKSQCKVGESYIFYTRDSVVRKRCINGMIARDTMKWDVQRRNGDNVLVLGPYTYQARAKIGDLSQVHLRILVDGKPIPSSEFILNYEKY